MSTVEEMGSSMGCMCYSMVHLYVCGEHATTLEFTNFTLVGAMAIFVVPLNTVETKYFNLGPVWVVAISRRLTSIAMILIKLAIDTSLVEKFWHYLWWCVPTTVPYVNSEMTWPVNLCQKLPITQRSGANIWYINTIRTYVWFVTHALTGFPQAIVLQVWSSLKPQCTAQFMLDHQSLCSLWC